MSNNETKANLSRAAAALESQTVDPENRASRGCLTFFHTHHTEQHTLCVIT
jgi:hypothetical protein